jgi:hypothetical protein
MINLHSSSYFQDADSDDVLYSLPNDEQFPDPLCLLKHVFGMNQNVKRTVLHDKQLRLALPLHCHCVCKMTIKHQKHLNRYTVYRGNDP